MDKQDEKMAAIVIEVFGIVVTSMGLSYEAATGADLGYIIITLGSSFTAVGALFWAKIVKGFKYE